MQYNSNFLYTIQIFFLFREHVDKKGPQYTQNNNKSMLYSLNEKEMH